MVGTRYRMWKVAVHILRGPKISENLSDLDNAYKGLYYNPRKSSPQLWLKSDDCITSTTMGVSSASQVLYRLVGLSLDHVVNAAKQHAEKNGRKDGLPTIYIDASWQS